MTARHEESPQQMQKALQETLSLLGQSREAVISYLEKYHNISLDGKTAFTAEKLGSAFDTIFGSGQQVLMRRFEDEMKKARELNDSNQSRAKIAKETSVQ